ncbi:uncharacterized protein LOC100680494 [Nasonia vitripennis]|uniref:Uncharacterized protein n=1 Tax=Nasonia vitripennis TaxID=7425 RepID=A0A7M7Q6T2_NASVI|nr:uncharacterized protein LOC100680494 [Nasonia vitripennis]
MKCPKYTLEENKSHQKTLAETWFCKNNSKAETSHENNSNKNRNENAVTKFKTPLIKFKNQDPLQISKSIINGTNSLYEDKENESDDNDIVVSSQSSNESKLRQKIGQSLSKKSVTPKVSPQKVKNISTPNLSEQNLSISDLGDTSLVKDELVTDMYDNVADYEPIELSHDLSSLLADPKLISNILSQPIIGMEMPEDQIENDPVQDPLHIDEKDEIEHLQSPPPKKRTRSNTFDKSTSKRVCYSSHDEEENYSRRKSNSKNKEMEDALPDELRKKLKLMKVKLQHQVPPQHKIENNAGSRPMSEEQSKEFETYGPLKRGSFTKSEDEIIRKNWQDFCEIHEWDENIVSPFLSMRHKGKYYIPELTERKNFVRFLANGLPWRSLYSVYFRFKNLFNVNVGTGKYSSKEDEIIMSHFRDASAAAIVNQCAKVAEILKRKRHSVWLRYQKLKKIHNLTNRKSDLSDYESDEREVSNKKKVKTKSRKSKTSYSDAKRQKKIIHEKVYTNVKWTSPLVNKFIETLIKETSSSNVQDLKYKKIDQSVWIKVEKSISVDRTTLQNFWHCQLHLQLFSPGPIYLNDTKMKLIEYMHENKEKNLEDILWADVCLSFDGITTDFLSKLFDHLIQHGQNKIDSNNLKEIVQYLYENHIPELEDKTTDVILPKLYYKGGRIICIDKGTEKKILNRITSDPLAEE